MPTHMKSIIAMLAYLSAIAAPSTFESVDGFVHNLSDTLHSAHATTQNSTSGMAPEQMKQTTGIVVDALRALGFLPDGK